MTAERQPRKDIEVDRIRSISWFYLIADAVGSDKATEVRKALEPHKNTVNRLGQDDKNEKFAHYRSGKRMPNATLIEYANRRVPGTQAYVEHTVWRVLRYRGPIQSEAIVWIGSLSSRAQNLMLSSKREVVASAPPLQLEALIKDRTLDGLAALTILLRLALDRDDGIVAWKCAIAIFQALVLMRNELVALNVGQLLYELYARRYLSSASKYSYVRAWDAFRFDLGSEVIHLYAELSRKKINGRMRHPDFYLIQAMSESEPRHQDEFLPMLIPDLEVGPPTEVGCQMLQERSELRLRLGTASSGAS